MTSVFNGKKLAKKKLALLVPRVMKLTKLMGRPPKLVALMVGENRASKIYVNEKRQSAEKVGIDFEFLHLSAELEARKIIQSIEGANKNDGVDGIMVQLPVEIQSQKFPPRGRAGKVKSYKYKILNTINVEKDVDCLTQENLELVKIGKPLYLPATVKAVLDILRDTQYEIRDKKVVVVGDKGFVGRPLAWALQRRAFQVKGVDLETKDLGKVTREADVLISATGQPNLIKKEMVKAGVVVIDVGYPKGDVDFDFVKDKTSFITPVPGGVGPVTVVCLLDNLVVASEAKLG